jgi:hypothetical protein
MTRDLPHRFSAARMHSRVACSQESGQCVAAILAPSGSVSRIRANLAALTLVRDIQRDDRPATPGEQAVLGRWAGWGAVPEVFDEERGERAEKVRSRAVGQDQDNMLKISGDSRRAALDLRLVGLEQETPGKAAVAAERIAAIWRDHRDHQYRAPDGTPYPVRGALQLVFCDLGTPGPNWNVYDDLRDQLVARGLPRESVRFIHEAKSDRDKAQLFAACRAGRVAVLVGSTEKMGVGTFTDHCKINIFLTCCFTSRTCSPRPVKRSARKGQERGELRRSAFSGHRRT